MQGLQIELTDFMHNIQTERTTYLKIRVLEDFVCSIEAHSYFSKRAIGFELFNKILKAFYAHIWITG